MAILKQIVVLMHFFFLIHNSKDILLIYIIKDWCLAYWKNDDLQQRSAVEILLDQVAPIRS